MRMSSGQQNISPRRITVNGDQKNGFIGKAHVSVTNGYANINNNNNNTNNNNINNISNNANNYYYYYCNSNSNGISLNQINSNGSGNSSTMYKNSKKSHHTDNSETSSDYWLWYAYAFIGFAAIGCYVNGIDGDFVHDDIPAITLNKDVLGTNKIMRTFFNDFWGTPMEDASSHKSYRPLTVLSFRWVTMYRSISNCFNQTTNCESFILFPHNFAFFPRLILLFWSYQMFSTSHLTNLIHSCYCCGCWFAPHSFIRSRLNYYLFGMKPIWFHLTNILLHAIVCVLFTRVCIIVAGLQDRFAVIAGIIFAVHPIHTEAVSRDNLCAMRESREHFSYLYIWRIGDWNSGTSRYFGMHFLFDISTCISWVSFFFYSQMHSILHHEPFNNFFFFIPFDILQNKPMTSPHITHPIHNNNTNQSAARIMYQLGLALFSVALACYQKRLV